MSRMLGSGDVHATGTSLGASGAEGVLASVPERQDKHCQHDLVSRAPRQYRLLPPFLCGPGEMRLNG